MTGLRTRRVDPTLFQRFLDQHHIPSALVEATLRKRLGGRAPDRKTLARWRHGRGEIRRKDMLRILWAVRSASGNTFIRLDELFDLDPENERIWED